MVSWFQNLFDARRKNRGVAEGVQRRAPHSSLGYRTLKEFAAALAAGFHTAERGQGTQTPSLTPRAPPSRLKPEMEHTRVVIFLRERKLGAGHSLASTFPRQVPKGDSNG
jgi:hypothetical protein